MAYTIIAESVEAGNGSYASVFTMPAGVKGLIGNVTAYNSAGAPITLTLAVGRQDGSTRVLSVESVSNGATASYSGGSTRRITPLAMREGESFKAQGGAAGVIVTISGLRFT